MPKSFRNLLQFRTGLTHGSVKDCCAHRNVRDPQTKLDVPTKVHFLCHLLRNIPGGTLTVFAYLHHFHRAVWRPCIICEVVPALLGMERRATWSAFVPSGLVQ